MSEGNEMETAVKIDISKEDIIDHVVEKHLEPIRDQLMEVQIRRQKARTEFEALRTDLNNAQRAAVDDQLKELVDIDAVNKLLEPIKAKLRLTWGDMHIDTRNGAVTVQPMLVSENHDSYLNCYGVRLQVAANQEMKRLDEEVQAKSIECNKIGDECQALAAQTSEPTVRRLRMQVKNRIMDTAMADMNGKLQKLLTEGKPAEESAA